jgi:hypothetical protein
MARPLSLFPHLRPHSHRLEGSEVPAEDDQPWEAYPKANVALARPPLDAQSFASSVAVRPKNASAVELAPPSEPGKDPVTDEVPEPPEPFPGSWNPSSPAVAQGGSVLDTMLYPENETTELATVAADVPLGFRYFHLTVSVSGDEVSRPVQLLVELGLEMSSFTLPLSVPPAGRFVFPVIVQCFSLILTVVFSVDVPPFFSGGLKVIVPEIPELPAEPQATEPFAVIVGFGVDAPALPARPTTREPPASANAAAPKMYLRKRTICSS